MPQSGAGATLYAGIEGGGTKFVCALARSPDDILESTSIPTGTPRATLAQCVEFFKAAQGRHGAIAALGFGCFGPIELRRGAQDYGRVLSTPKAGWSRVDLLELFKAAFDVPIALDTDVAAAALAEWQLGAGRNRGSVAYVTVGTGIGGAVAPADFAAGRLMHAEMGHIPVRRDPRDRDFAGLCPFHGDCLEGLASGSAIRARWGCSLDQLPPDHDGPRIVAGYLGQMAAAIALMLSVERIVFGGGVMSHPAMLELVREAAARYLNSYVEVLRDALTDYICAPALGAGAGITGALLLARHAASGDDQFAADPPGRC
jgi:fructokinase